MTNLTEILTSPLKGHDLETWDYVFDAMVGTGVGLTLYVVAGEPEVSSLIVPGLLTTFGGGARYLSGQLKRVLTDYGGT